MPRPLIPLQLTSRPFTVDEARAAGLSLKSLAGDSWRHLGPGTYALEKLRVDPLLLLRAARLRVPGEAAFSGLTAAWLHGIDVAPCSPIQVTSPQGLGVSGRSGLRVSRARLDPGDVVLQRGLRATSICRTLADLARSLPLREAVAVTDMALRDGLVALPALRAYPVGRELRFARLLRVAELAEPGSESRMESLLRMVLVQAGLPRPQVQAPLRDRGGSVFGRADLYYPSHRLVIEYDGGTHRQSLVEDDWRQNLILTSGYDILRYAAPDVLNRPESVVAQVRGRLQGRCAGATLAS